MINIRNELEKDYRIVEKLSRDAFWNLYIKGCEEHYVINKMRSHEDFIKDLTFVIEFNGEIIGGIFATKSKIVQNNGEIDSLTFGPVFISPKYQRKGFGRKLINHFITKAKEYGYRAILTLGYPYHYEPYGFLGGKKYNISMEDGKFYKGLLVLPLYEGALDCISGYAKFSDVFNCDMNDVEKFDNENFEYKEKLVTESQKEFQNAVSLLDQ